MRNLFGRALCSLLIAGLFLPVFAQQTGEIVGTVSLDGNPLPGVVVTAESDALQGKRSAVSTENGSFVLRLLPPGSYTLTATMAGMQTQKQTVVVSVGGVLRPRIELAPESTSEVIVVTADSNPVLDTTQVTSNFKADLLENLPRNRDILGAVNLAPGVTASGPGNAPVISGAMSFENTYLLNGGMINSDNVRGAPGTLFIEDAIEQTSVITGSVSAEFGQFTGGVVNTITKQGGNDFSGSIRFSFENDKWRSLTPLEKDSGIKHEDDISDFETLTIGGPIIKDRLWFFLAGRRERDTGAETVSAGSPISDEIAAELGLPAGQGAPGERALSAGVDEDRYEFKLTGTIVEDHTVVLSYLDRAFDELNDTQFGVLSPNSVVSSRSIPQTLLTVNYRGIFSPVFSVDATYSKRQLTFEREGAGSTDFVTGSTLEDFNTQGGLNYGAHFFGAAPEERDNQFYNIKGSFFLTTGSGTHDLVFGYSSFTDRRKADNHQSPSDWRIFPSATYFQGDTPIPVFVNGFESDNSLFGGAAYYPILNPSQGSHFNVDSIYVNDSWTLNPNWRFNLGFRYDKNDATSQDGAKVSDDDKVSPRISISYDLNGDGKHVFTANYGTYVARLSNAADGATTSGSPAIYYWYYLGPQTSDLNEVYNWYVENYGSDFYLPENARNNADFVREPGSTTVLGGSLKSPSSTEITVGYSTRFSDKGYFKVDYINRDFEDFYTGITNVGDFTPTGADQETIINDPGLYTREYNGVQMQGQWRFNERISIAGNYTWSQLRGNIEGETGGSGSIRSTSLGRYPEYNNYDNRDPIGYLSADTRHAFRIWGGYDLKTQFGKFNFSALQRFQSGDRFTASGTVPVTSAYGFLSRSELGYRSVPSTNTYFFSGRGEYKLDDWYATDLGINYSINFKRLEFFLQIDIFNIFNQDAVVDAANVDTSVIVDRNNPFNVYTDTPVEGVNYRLGDNFGNPTDNAAYQNPREFRFDVGFRF
ncbi:MAG: TonB-dependent receptor [Acidobacteria bacterium]|nr:TonB-dependent receptor [Acidobacteriota bacterium]